MAEIDRITELIMRGQDQLDRTKVIGAIRRFLGTDAASQEGK